IKMSRAPTNHAERPLLVMKLAVTVAIITMVTAVWPELQAHRRRSDDIAEQHQRGCDEQSDLGGAAERDADTHVEALLARRRKGHGKLGGDADSETMMKPTKAGLIPKVSAAFCTDSTESSLTSATSTVTTSSVPTARPIGQCSSLSPCSALANNSLWVFSENSRPSA